MGFVQHNFLQDQMTYLGSTILLLLRRFRCFHRFSFGMPIGREGISIGLDRSLLSQGTNVLVGFRNSDRLRTLMLRRHSGWSKNSCSTNLYSTDSSRVISQPVGMGRSNIRQKWVGEVWLSSLFLRHVLAGKPHTFCSRASHLVLLRSRLRLFPFLIL